MQISLVVQLSEQEAWDLAQFLKRVGYSDFRSNAVDDDEAYRMLITAEKVRQGLIAIGINPRWILIYAFAFPLLRTKYVFARQFLT